MRLIDGDKLASDLMIIAQLERAKGLDDIALVFERMAEVVNKQPEIHIDKID